MVWVGVRGGRGRGREVGTGIGIGVGTKTRPRRRSLKSRVCDRYPGIHHDGLDEPEAFR